MLVIRTDTLIRPKTTDVDVYETEIDLGERGKMSGTYRVSPDFVFSTLANTTMLPIDVCWRLLSYPIDGEYETPEALCEALKVAHRPEDVNKVAALFGY